HSAPETRTTTECTIHTFNHPTPTHTHSLSLPDALPIYYAAKTLGDSMPGVQGMWGFQLIGYAAKSLTNNFDDWSYNGSNWWSGADRKSTRRNSSHVKTP